MMARMMASRCCCDDDEDPPVHTMDAFSIGTVSQNPVGTGTTDWTIQGFDSINQSGSNANLIKGNPVVGFGMSGVSILGAALTILDNTIVWFDDLKFDLYDYQGQFSQVQQTPTSAQDYIFKAVKGLHTGSFLEFPTDANAFLSNSVSWTQNAATWYSRSSPDWLHDNPTSIQTPDLSTLANEAIGQGSFVVGTHYITIGMYPSTPTEDADETTFLWPARHIATISANQHTYSFTEGTPP